MVTTQSSLTVGEVGKMTTFELRQEVEKRGLLTDLQLINHDTLLRRLVQVDRNRRYTDCRPYTLGTVVRVVD